MDLSTVHNGVHKLRKKKRPGRGIGSGHGKTASRGYKGQGSRAGAELPSQLYEGGQMPLIRRVPKRGFSHETWRKFYVVVNLGDLEKQFDNNANVDEAALRAAGLVRGPADGVRILGGGELTKKLNVRANYVTKSAAEKIQAKGGRVDLIPPPKKPDRNKMKPRPPKNPVG
jgi:large subunit ribosomal protein L15